MRCLCAVSQPSSSLLQPFAPLIHIHNMMARLPTQEQELQSAALVASSCTIRVSHLSDLSSL